MKKHLYIVTGLIAILSTLTITAYADQEQDIPEPELVSSSSEAKETLQASPEAAAVLQAPVLSPLQASITYPAFPDGSSQSALKIGDPFSVEVASPDLLLHDVSVDVSALGLPAAVPLSGTLGHFTSDSLTVPHGIADGERFITVHAHSALGTELSTSVRLVVDSTPPAGWVQSTFTKDAGRDGIWQAHITSWYDGTGSEAIVIHGTLYGMDEDGSVLGKIPVETLSIATATPIFTADLALPEPHADWQRISMGLTFIDEAGNIFEAHSASFPRIELHPVIIDHAFSGSVIHPSNYVPAGIPDGIGIAHSLINGIPAGDYYAVVFFKNIDGCPSDNYEINSFIPGKVWGEDIVGPNAPYEKAYGSHGGGCMQQFHVNPNRSGEWLWGALSNTGSSSAIADTDGIPAFAICATKKACDPITPRLGSPVPPEATSTPRTSGISSVLFLPGIKGSKLYERNPLCLIPLDTCDVPLWLPVADATVPELFMDEIGKSKRTVYIKDSGILANAYGLHFYDSFMQTMGTYAASTTLPGWSWKPIAYDWRMALPDLVKNGAKDGDNILFEEPSETPYIEQNLRELASSSPTGKVTILAHSNGGLVAKELMQKLGDTETARLIDRVVFVGVPQSGAPRALASLLYGDGEGLPGTGAFPNALMSTIHARQFALNSPMAYHLLPSSAYFSMTADPSHPLMDFGDGPLLSRTRAAFGTSINTADELIRYSLGQEEGRRAPSTANLHDPALLNPTLLTYAKDEHTKIDAWQPPAGVSLYQIGGWGDDTVSGIHLYEQQTKQHGKVSSEVLYRPQFIEDGDGTVPIPSSLMTSTSSRSFQYWVNLPEASHDGGWYDHSNLFEIPEVNELIGSILHGTTSLPRFITPAQPNTHSPQKKLLFTLHGPASLHVSEDVRHSAGLRSQNQAIASPTMSKNQSGHWGETNFVLVPAGTSYHVDFAAEEDGFVTFDLQELENGTVVGSSTIASIPVTPWTSGSLRVHNDLSDISPLFVHEDNSEKADFSVTPLLGQTVFAEDAVQPVEENQNTTGTSTTSVASGSAGMPATALHPQVLGSSSTPNSNPLPPPASRTPKPPRMVRWMRGISVLSKQAVIEAKKDTPVRVITVPSAATYSFWGTVWHMLTHEIPLSFGAFVSSLVDWLLKPH